MAAGAGRKIRGSSPNVLEVVCPTFSRTFVSFNCEALRDLFCGELLRVSPVPGGGMSEAGEISRLLSVALLLLCLPKFRCGCDLSRPNFSNPRVSHWSIFG